MVEPHELYVRLASTAQERLKAYKGLMRILMMPMTEIRASWQTGAPLGGDTFREKVEETLGRKVGQARRGRPIKNIKGL
jgi:putative transposase